MGVGGRQEARCQVQLEHYEAPVGHPIGGVQQAIRAMDLNFRGTSQNGKEMCVKGNMDKETEPNG